MSIKDPDANRAYQRQWAKAKYHKNLEASRAKQHTPTIRAYKTAWANARALKQREALWAQYRTIDPLFILLVLLKRIAANKARPHLQYLRHRAKKLADMQAWQAAHPEQVKGYKKGWKQRNPERVNAQARKDHLTRRARKAMVLDDLTHAQWLEIQAAQDYRCYYCGKRCKGKLTQDHITPLSQGGSHTLHNVIAACRSCNSKKNNRAPLTPVQPLLLTIAPSKKQKAS